MSVSSRQRVFGAKPAAIQRQTLIRAVAPSELHHNGGRLLAWAAISAVFVIASLWAVTAGGFGADYRGRDAVLVHLLGPQGMVLLFALCGLGCALLGAAYLRLLVSKDRLAARAAPDGLAINGVWGRKFYIWRDVVAVRLHVTRPRSREIVFIRIERADGGSQLVSTNTIEGGRAVVESWIQDVQSFLHR
jgi:hypothetical protein